MLSDLAALDRYVDPALIGDPALNILLFLFAEGRGGAPTTTSACCAAARVPRTTALRYIKLLMARGLLRSSHDDVDKRMTLLALTDETRHAVAGWLGEIALPTG